MVYGRWTHPNVYKAANVCISKIIHLEHFKNSFSFLPRLFQVSPTKPIHHVPPTRSSCPTISSVLFLVANTPSTPSPLDQRTGLGPPGPLLRSRCHSRNVTTSLVTYFASQRCEFTSSTTSIVSNGCYSLAISPSAPDASANVQSVSIAGDQSTDLCLVRAFEDSSCTGSNFVQEGPLGMGTFMQGGVREGVCVAGAFWDDGKVGVGNLMLVC